MTLDLEMHSISDSALPGAPKRLIQWDKSETEWNVKKTYQLVAFARTIQAYPQVLVVDELKRELECIVNV